jgi:hypothetical protein
MEGKLIKVTDDIGVYYVLNGKNLPENYVLSDKNCQAIERGYDLDNMSDLFGAKAKGNLDFKLGANYGFEAGFQKALELLGDRKYSEEDLRKAMDKVWDWCKTEKDTDFSTITELRNKHIQSLQQTEWDVEILMEEEKEFIFDSAMGISQGHYLDKPKLDADGCLILKRI